MKSLLILRHAEAADARSGQSEERRPLTDRGRDQARALGIFLAARGMVPNRVLCSAAARANETAGILCAAANCSVAVTALDALYNAAGDELLNHAKREADEHSQLLLVAHAPGVAECVSLLTTTQFDLAMICAPATLAEVIFDTRRWSEITAGTGALRLLVPPLA
jgi:phosphohistidine phosphatase